MGVNRQRNNGYKAEQVKYSVTRPLEFPPRSLPQPLYTPLSQVGSDQAAGKRAGRVHYEKREVTQQLHYTCPTPEAVHWARQQGRPQH